MTEYLLFLILLAVLYAGGKLRNIAKNLYAVAKILEQSGNTPEGLFVIMRLLMWDDDRDRMRKKERCARAAIEEWNRKHKRPDPESQS